jgi:creatinine amidohydrolase
MSELANPEAFAEVRLELLRPHQIRDAIGQHPVAYVPLGTLEWHSEHLPVGLDSLTAYGICLRAARAAGGVVLPPLYYGTGGDHGRYPWTIMLPNDEQLEPILRCTIERLGDFGVRTVVLFSGHFAGPQVALVKRLADVGTGRGATPSVIGFAVNEVEGLPIPPDHAGIFETTLLAELHPQLVDTSRLPTMTDGPMPESDSWSEARHQPSHPLYGIFGPDPRPFDPATAPQLVAKAVEWLVARVRSASERPMS